jgi:hypothetical protein
VICLSAVAAVRIRASEDGGATVALEMSRDQVGDRVWGCGGDGAKALDRFGQSRPHRLLISLTDGIQVLRGWDAAAAAR